MPPVRSKWGNSLWTTASSPAHPTSSAYKALMLLSLPGTRAPGTCFHCRGSGREKQNSAKQTQVRENHIINTASFYEVNSIQDTPNKQLQAHQLWSKAAFIPILHHKSVQNTPLWVLHSQFWLRRLRIASQCLPKQLTFLTVFDPFRWNRIIRLFGITWYVHDLHMLDKMAFLQAKIIWRGT